MDEIKEMGTSRGSGIQCLTIVGQIEGHQLQPDDVKTTKYEHVLPLIAAIEEGLLKEVDSARLEGAMTIHPVRLNGVVIGVPQTYNYFSRIQERIVGFVTRHSRIPREDYMRLMTNTDELANDVGSVIYGEEAVHYGLIDQIGTLADALDYLHGQIGR